MPLLSARQATCRGQSIESRKNSFVKMVSRSTKATLNAMVQAPSFSLKKKGDTLYGTAPGFWRTRDGEREWVPPQRPRVLVRGVELTDAGTYVAEQGVAFPRTGLDPTLRTEYRGNSEYGWTQDGGRVRLRTPTVRSERLRPRVSKSSYIAICRRRRDGR